MNSIAIKGIICPILTPMYEDESINEQELRNQVNRLIDAGIHGLFAFGTNGESYALSTAEKERVLEIVVEETNHRVPVYAGSGCITTKETIALSKKAFEIGADALSIVTPFYAAASQEELYAHYMDVASAVDMPIVMYNIPPRTGNALAPATVRRLAQSAPNIVGVKDSSGNFDNMKQYIEQTATLDREFSVLSGNDSLILPALVFGGKGGIAGCACGATSFLRNSDKIYEKKRNASQAPGRRFWPSAAARTRTRSWRPLWTRWWPPGSLIVRSVGWRWTTRPTPCDCYCSKWGGM